MIDTEKRNRNIVMVIMAIAIIVLILLNISQCENRQKQESVFQDNLAAQSDSVKLYKNELGTITASKLVLQYSHSELKQQLQQWQKTGTQAQKELAVLTKKYDKLISVSQIDFNVGVDVIEIPFKDSIPATFKPFLTSVRTDYYNLDLYVSNKDAKVIDLYMPTSQSVVTGFKRQGLFKKDLATTEVTFGNPHIEVTKMSGHITTIETPWYKKWYIWLVTGLIGGLIIK